MGRLIEGQWHDDWYDTEANQGLFVRDQSKFRHWITPNGAPGETGSGGFGAEAGRYHLYASLACPWAHRTLIFRILKGLEDMISVSFVNPYMGSDGWTFTQGRGVIPDSVNNKDFLHEIYTLAAPTYCGRVTVPVLWDKKKNTIVSNESSEIIRMFNSAFDGIGAVPGDYYPALLRDEIDRINTLVYSNVNDGVYRAGFATTQEAYEGAVIALFYALDRLEEILETRRYLAGDRLTEADWRLFTTLVRFDPVYHGHFKTNIRQLRDYPNLWGFVRDLYQMPGIADTVDMESIKTHYYVSHTTINPTAIVPAGPDIDFAQPHERANRFAAKLPNAATPLPSAPEEAHS